MESLRRDFSLARMIISLCLLILIMIRQMDLHLGSLLPEHSGMVLQANGGTVNLDWDIKWRSAVKNYDDRWVAEFAIPFRSMRYNGGASEWGINFSRQDLKTNEKSSWAPMPRQFATATLAFTGSLVWDKPLPSSGLEIFSDSICISKSHSK